MQGPNTAVILAAGMGTRLGARGLSIPKGFLRLGDSAIIEESLTNLRSSGIERVVIVTGHCNEWYDRLAAASGGFVQTVHNARFADSGSMYSLYCARDAVQGDFLLLESDIIYERRALTEVLGYERDNCVLLSGLTRSNDEVFVETQDGQLIAMSKDSSRLAEIAGELVGVSKISERLFSVMIEIAERAFASSLKFDYETDCLVEAAKRLPVYCHVVSDLAWAEIDDESHLRRALDRIHPEIRQRDSEAVTRN